jgi:hypothetical protein
MRWGNQTGHDYPLMFQRSQHSNSTLKSCANCQRKDHNRTECPNIECNNFYQPLTSESDNTNENTVNGTENTKEVNIERCRSRERSRNCQRRPVSSSRQRYQERYDQVYS